MAVDESPKKRVWNGRNGCPVTFEILSSRGLMGNRSDRSASDQFGDLAAWLDQHGEAIGRQVAELPLADAERCRDGQQNYPRKSAPRLARKVESRDVGSTMKHITHAMIGRDAHGYVLDGASELGGFVFGESSSATASQLASLSGSSRLLETNALIAATSRALTITADSQRAAEIRDTMPRELPPFTGIEQLNALVRKMRDGDVA